MEYLHTLIGIDCLNIILNYKNEFERIEYNHKSIDNCIFEEHNKKLLKRLFVQNVKFEWTTKYPRKYYLNNMSLGEFKKYYIEQNYIQAVTFKFSINNEIDDYFQGKIRNIKSQYMKNIKIKYIYKLNTFELCLFLGMYQGEQLVKLYEHIAYDIFEYPNPVEVILQH